MEWLAKDFGSKLHIADGFKQYFGGVTDPLFKLGFARIPMSPKINSQLYKS